MASRGIDHVVWAVADLEAARARFAALGFTLTPPARHPFGTENSLAQFGSSFIELLTLAEPARVVPMADNHFSFSAANAAFLASGEGLSMAVLSSADSRADNACWSAAGLRTYEPVDFGRKARLPSGAEVHVSFTIAFAIDPLAPEAVFFVCQQHAPEHFWKRDFQRHGNGAGDISRITLLAEQPAAHEAFFRRFCFDGQIELSPTALRVRMDRGEILVQHPELAAQSFPEGCLPGPDGASPFAAVTLSVPDLAATARCLREARAPFRERPGRLFLPAGTLFGCALEFQSS